MIEKRRQVVLRRKLFAYSISMMMGIISAFTVLEHRSVICGILFLMTCPVICVYAERIGLLCRRESKCIVFLLIMGAVIFSCAYDKMEVDDIKASSQVMNGTITKVEQDDEKLTMTVESERVKEGRVLCRYYGNIDKVVKGSIYNILGSKVRMYGKIKAPSVRRNPGCFDYALYLKSRNVVYCFTARNIVIEDCDVSMIYRVRKRILKRRESFQNEFRNEGSYGLIKGIIFGDKNDLDEDTYEEFIENNTAHILAVSGLHIGFILSALRALTRSRKTISVSLLILLIMLAYGEMTLWNISTVRSIMVAAMGMMAFYFKKPFDLLSALSAGAFIILAFSPYQLFNAGFQMSFIAMVGIAFLSGPLRYFVGSIMASLFSVQIAMFPYIAMIFNRFNPLSAFVNIPVVFLAGLITPLSVFTLAAGIYLDDYPDILIMIIDSLAQLMMRINSDLNTGGMFSARTVSINPGVTLFVYIAMFFVCSEIFRIMMLRKEKKRILQCFMMIMIPVIIIGISYRNTFSNDEIVFIDVGQGDAIHMRAAGRDVLFDGGGSRNYNVGKQILTPYFLKNNAYDIDLNFLTHLHTDHYKGSMELGNEMYVRRRLLSEEYSEAGEKITRPLYLKTGDVVKIGEGIRVKALWPLEDSSVPEDENEMNMVMMIYYGKIKIMITGDLLEQDERDMVEYYSGTDELKCDILKVAHHGSKSSSCDVFLDVADPELAVIQVGADNMYGHPSPETLKKLSKRGIKVYRNDRNGAVGIDIRRDSIKIDKMIG